MKALSAAIAKDRLKLGLTQEQLAAAAGVPYQSLTKWERGITLPRDQKLDQLSEFFGQDSATAEVAKKIKDVRIYTRVKGSGMNAELEKIKKTDESVQTYNLPGVIAYETDFYVSNEGYVIIEQECDSMRVALTPEQLEQFVDLVQRNDLVAKAYRQRMDCNDLKQQKEN